MFEERKVARSLEHHQPHELLKKLRYEEESSPEGVELSEMVKA